MAIINDSCVRSRLWIARRLSRYAVPLLICHLLVVLAWGQTLNILNNGNFETGLMCYSNWIWSATGQDFLGDYKFLLSTDAHSGSYSAEIRCVGTDCSRAGIYSDKIQTPPSQSYKLSVYSKCPAGQSAFARIPFTTVGDYYKPLTCNGNWAPNEVFFTIPADVTQFWFYLFDYGSSWLRVDDVVLTYADGTVPQTPVLHAGNRNVRISGQNLLVDSKPYLALGFFDVGYNDLSQAAATGANTVNGININASANCFNTYRQSYLDRAYELGLNFVPNSSSTARLGVPAVFSNVMPVFAPHKANIVWFLDDEPDQQAVSWWYIPPSSLISSYQAIKAVSHLPVMNDFQHAAWSTAADTQPYLGSSDIWMAEPYGSGFTSVVNAINNFNSLNRQPIWLAQDAISPDLIVPKAYWTIINGARGIIYFDWDTFKADSAKLTAASQAFNELRQLQGAIFASDISSQITAPFGVGSIARSWNGATYILSVNPSTNTATGNFIVPSLQSGTQVAVMFENRTITANAGSFVDSFAGISRHVYVIPSSPHQKAK